MVKFQGACNCGEVAFETQSAPLLRAYCHCAICRAYHNADRADFSVFRAKYFVVKPGGHVTYRAHKQPPLLLRGNCDSCAAPILEKARIPGIPKLMLIPSRWIVEQEDLPKPAFHMFHDLRQGETDDDLPKANGYLASQIKFAAHLLPALFR